MRSRWALSALAIASAVASGCGPKVKPGLRVVGDKLSRPSIVRWSATTSWASTSRTRRAHEAVGAGKLPLAGCADAGVRPRRGAAAVDELRAGGARRGEALDGFGLAKPVKLVVRDRAPARDVRQSPGTVGHADQRDRDVFNQPVRRRDVEKRCGYVVRRQARRGGRRQHRRDAKTRAPASSRCRTGRWRWRRMALRVQPRADRRRGAAGPGGDPRSRRARRTRRRRRRARERDRVRDLRPVEGRRRWPRGAARSRRTSVDRHHVLEPAGGDRRRAADQGRAGDRGLPRARRGRRRSRQLQRARAAAEHALHHHRRRRARRQFGQRLAARTSPSSAPATARPAWTSRPAPGSSSRRAPGIPPGRAT